MKLNSKCTFSITYNSQMSWKKFVCHCFSKVWILCEREHQKFVTFCSNLFYSGYNDNFLHVALWKSPHILCVSPSCKCLNGKKIRLFPVPLVFDVKVAQRTNTQISPLRHFGRFYPSRVMMKERSTCLITGDKWRPNQTDNTRCHQRTHEHIILL